MACEDLQTNPLRVVNLAPYQPGDMQDDCLVMLAEGSPGQPHSHRMNIAALPAVPWVVKIGCSAIMDIRCILEL